MHANALLPQVLTPPDPAARSLKRLRPRLESQFAAYAALHPQAWQDFLTNLEVHFGRLFHLLLPLYGDQYDFFYTLEELLTCLAQSWAERPDDLKKLDHLRQANPDWYQSNQMLGGVCYVDL